MSLAKIAQTATEEVSPDEFIHAADDVSFEDDDDDVNDLRMSKDDDVVMEAESFPGLDVILQDLDLEEPEDVILILPALPGSDLTEEDLADIVVDEPEDVVVDDKPKDPWDWRGHGLPKFFDWTNERIKGIPKHSGNDVGGIERAIAYLETLKKSISSAVRTDLKGELDIAKVETIRESVEDGIDRLEDRLKKLVDGKAKKKKKASGEYSSLKKEAQLSPTIGSIVVTVPLLISRIARVCINGHVSAGKDIEDLFKKQAAKYKLSDREQAEALQLIEDMGYPVFRDRGYMVDEDYDRRSEDNFDAGPNYPA